MQQVFVYGSLKKGGRAHDLLHGCVFLAEGVTVSKYRVFGKSFPMAILDKFGHSLKGEIYQIPDSAMKNLDRYENYPSLYWRDKFMVRSIDNPGIYMACWIYHIKDTDGMFFNDPLEPEDGVLSWDTGASQEELTMPF